ncbi:hypothetical protein AQ621_16990 (plasmid) [Marinobacter sp. P4B1]|nr:hypothetical protein AQ621_16990 [Marinobacter sp. P4B1]
MLLGAMNASADEAAVSGSTCRSASVFERMFTQICWSCMTPIRLTGVDFFGGDVPSRASKDYFCHCNNKPGLPFSTWMPRELIEVVKEPGCSPTLGGTKLPFAGNDWGNDNGAAGMTGNDREYRNVHKFAFPIGEMLNMVGGCPIQANELDLLNMTEWYPTWRDDLMAAIVFPETIIFANPAALAACAADSAMTGFAGNEPSRNMYFCAGAWGTVYPMVGGISGANGKVDQHGLLATRMMALSHRLMTAGSSIGDRCSRPLALTLPRDQYKLQHFWPEAQSGDNHYIGESSFRWGPHRGSFVNDTLKIVWRWEDCCLRPVQ